MKNCVPHLELSIAGRTILVLMILVILQMGNASSARADGGVVYLDIVSTGGSGINYRRKESPRNAILDDIKSSGPFVFLNDGPSLPGKPRGAPGVAVFDYDNDGDLDIYVTNGPGTPNSLYSNQLEETGGVSFIDVAGQAGVEVTAQDSTGVCYGDIDNDGDRDLYVLTLGEANRLFENKGDGGYLDITNESNAGGGIKHPASCAMGDVNGDGLLDIVIGNSWNNWDHRLPLARFEYLHLVEHNQLYRNNGDNKFEEVAEIAGIQNFAGITCAISLVDLDLDGDADLVVADDQGTKPPAIAGGLDHGVIRIYRNDGTGNFTDVTGQSGTNRPGVWMGLAFADLDHDGLMDIVASNAGDYVMELMSSVVSFAVPAGSFSTGWFFAQDDGSYNFPGVGELGATPFSWGVAVLDYDNDGDTDIISHGGLDMGVFVEASNPGALLENDGSGNFNRDFIALSGSVNHTRRNVQGLAAGDINNDGFVDVISVSNQDWPQAFFLVPYLSAGPSLGGQFDGDAFVWPTFVPLSIANPALGSIWSGLEPVDGTLAVEVNSASNGNAWVKVRLLGSDGLARHGRANRDGIGAVVSFTPKNGRPAMQPVLGGSSYASQNGLEITFGLASESSGTLDVLWPGGIRNRLYNVNASERLLFPEIPCDFSDGNQSIRDYFQCVKRALRDLRVHGILDRKQVRRFYASARRAFFQYKRDNQ